MMRRPSSPLLPFLLKGLFPLALLALLTSGCQKAGQPHEGTLKLLYTSDAIGYLDPCG